ncbi:MAG: hypothetical protein U1E88_03460 [Acinetobacter sp.]
MITTHWQKFIPIGQNWLKTVLADEINAVIDKAAKEVVANLKTVFDANIDTSKGYPNIFKLRLMQILLVRQGSGSS